MITSLVHAIFRTTAISDTHSARGVFCDPSSPAICPSRIGADRSQLAAKAGAEPVSAAPQDSQIRPVALARESRLAPIVERRKERAPPA